MYEKIACTLASDHEVYIIGQPAGQFTAAKNSHAIALRAFSRLNVRRLVAPFNVLRHVWRIKPDLLIICTAELLPIAFIARLLGVKLIYDVQENYAQNIRHGQAWPWLTRPLLAGGVRLLESAGSLLCCHFLLAEQSYVRELRFIGRKFTVLENKAVRTGQPFRARLRVSGGIRLLFSGTLAESTGVFSALELACQLHAADHQVRLSVIGYAAQPAVRVRLREAAQRLPFVELVGIDELIPHKEVIQELDKCDFGIVSYPPNPSTWHSYPTKLYEYLGHGLPMLLVNNPLWVSYCAPYSAAVVFDDDPHRRDAAEILQAMRQQTFYPEPAPDVFWESEAPKLLQAVASCF